jgi:hypothetical protein
MSDEREPLLQSSGADDRPNVRLIRLDAPLTSLDDDGRTAYMQDVAQAVADMMPPGPDPNGRALFFLLIPDVDQSGQHQYVTNCDVRTLAPALGALSERFGNARGASDRETLCNALRQLSDVVEEWEQAHAPGNAPDAALCERYADARTAAILALDAVAPDAMAPKIRKDGNDHASETQSAGTPGNPDDRRTDVSGEGFPPGTGAPAAAAGGDPEPFRPHPSEPEI